MMVDREDVTNLLKQYEMLGRTLGLDRECLIEAVHEVMTAKAARINRLGPRAEIKFLAEEWGVARVREWLDNAAEEGG